MPSSYSTNLKIELQATGENSGTWGTITNTNLGTALEQAVVGYGNPSYPSDANLTLTYTDTNAAQAARALVLNVTSAVSLSATRELVVPTIQKQYIVQNNTSGSQSITVKTSAGTGITVPNGRKAHLYVNGTDVIFMDDYVDINGGSIDGTTIGANSAAAGNFTTVDTTNIEVTNLKAKDGTTAGSIADATGVVTLGSSVLTTTDINGGTIDGTTIGGSSAAAGTFTTLTTSSTVTLNGGTANGVLYLNGSKVATSGSALTFDGAAFNVSSSGLPISTFTSSGVTTALVLNNTNANGWGSNLAIQTGGTPAGYFGTIGSLLGNTTQDIAVYANTGNGFRVYTNGNNLRATFDSSGNLGIGTASPSDILTLAGGASGSYGLTINNAKVGGGTKAIFQYDATNQIALVGGNTTNGLAFQTLTSGSLTTKAVIDASGNLGLGFTPRAWAGGYKALDIIGPGAIASTASGDTFTQVANGAWFNGTNWIYQYTGIGAARYQMTGPSGGGNHSWYVANSGTAGNAISFTQAMTLTAAGSLGLGTTSPTERLDVVGGGLGVGNGTIKTVISYTTEGLVGTVSNHALLLYANNAERARILSTGEFLAGATSAISVAGVSGFHGLSADANNKWAAVVRNTTSSTPFGLAINYSAAAPNNTSSNFVYCYDSGALRASIRANGGLANYQANNVDLSDARTKKDIAPAASMWGKVAALEIVAYKYNDQTHDDVNLGVIAQQVESVEPVWVDADGFGDTPEDGVPLKTVYTKDITFAAIKALQEAMARIETLEAKVTALESK